MLNQGTSSWRGGEDSAQQAVVLFLENTRGRDLRPLDVTRPRRLIQPQARLVLGSNIFPLSLHAATEGNKVAPEVHQRIVQAFERERVRDVFSRFVPETVVDQVLARTDKDLRLGGVSLESTVMFTDLRGFTTFSEALPPARVIECLNVYLSEMTEALNREGWSKRDSRIFMLLQEERAGVKIAEPEEKIQAILKNDRG